MRAANHSENFAPCDFVDCFSRQHATHIDDQAIRFAHTFVEMLEVEILITFI